MKNLSINDDDLSGAGTIKRIQIFQINKQKQKQLNHNNNYTMMKSFTIATAALCASAMAMQPKLVLSYRDTDDYFLGLKHGNPTHMKMPRDHRVKQGTCDGWQLRDADRVYDSFRLDVNAPPEGEQGCTNLVFAALPDAEIYDEESVVFIMNCDEGQESLTINVQVYDNEGI